MKTLSGSGHVLEQLKQTRASLVQLNSERIRAGWSNRMWSEMRWMREPLPESGRLCVASTALQLKPYSALRRLLSKPARASGAVRHRTLCQPKPAAGSHPVSHLKYLARVPLWGNFPAFDALLLVIDSFPSAFDMLL